MRVQERYDELDGTVLTIIGGLSCAVIGYIAYAEWADGGVAPYVWSALIPLVILFGLQARFWVGSIRRGASSLD
jgi:hypothetical protein